MNESYLICHEASINIFNIYFKDYHRETPKCLKLVWGQNRKYDIFIQWNSESEFILCYNLL